MEQFGVTEHEYVGRGVPAAMRRNNYAAHLPGMEIRDILKERMDHS